MEKYPTIWRKIENKVIQSDEFIVKKGRRYNISVLINHHQDVQKMKRLYQVLFVDIYIYIIYIYIYIWRGRLLNTPTESLQKDKTPHIHNNWFGLVWFYGTSTIVGYLMPNSLYINSLVLWHINHCRLLMPNPFFIHINSSTSNNSV